MGELGGPPSKHFFSISFSFFYCLIFFYRIQFFPPTLPYVYSTYFFSPKVSAHFLPGTSRRTSRYFGAGPWRADRPTSQQYTSPALMDLTGQ